MTKKWLTKILFPPLGRQPLGTRDLEDSLFFLKNRVRALQSHVTNINTPHRRRSGAAGTSRNDAGGPEPEEDNGAVGYADIIKRELEKIVQEDKRSEESCNGTVL